jgi:glycosyltransferase involved in cell wall biosynthesis
MKAEAKPSLGLITIEGPGSLSGFATDRKLVKVLRPLSSGMTWIATNCSGDESQLPPGVKLVRLELEHADRESLLRRFFVNLRHEMRLVSHLRRLKGTDIFVFYGGYVPLLPFLYTALCLRRRTVLRIEGRSSVVLKKRMRPAEIDNRLLRMVAHGLIEKITYSLAHRIVIEYSSMTEKFELQKYARKIALGNHYVDTGHFRKMRGLAGRKYILGYFGRFSHEKGIIELAEALPLVLKERGGRVLIVGEGRLGENVREMLAGVGDRVEMAGWVDREKMPEYLTPAGGIPDVIKDGQTGFIMEDNSPECITRNIIRVLSHPDLEEIAANAHALVEKEYAFDTVVARYRDILGS